MSSITTLCAFGGIGAELTATSSRTHLAERGANDCTGTARAADLPRRGAGHLSGIFPHPPAGKPVRACRVHVRVLAQISQHRSVRF